MTTWILIIFFINFHNGDSRMKIIASYADDGECATAARQYIATHHDKHHTLDYTCEYVVETRDDDGYSTVQDIEERQVSID
jgi:hypothetical protein